jgi:tripartite-type tricarboxylate transporter receptor subunit TctC
MCGVFAPGRTPRDIVFKLNAAVVKILEQPDFRAQLARDGLSLRVAHRSGLTVIFAPRLKAAAVIRASGAKAMCPHQS